MKVVFGPGEARVRIDDRVAGEIGRGLVVLLGIARDDAPEDAAYAAAKLRDIRIFEGDAGRHMDRSVADVRGSVLVISQFTLYGDVRKGRRPSFDG
jgi:D-tyrosyl-tRNA(Tyr) deacylase